MQLFQAVSLFCLAAVVAAVKPKDGAVAGDPNYVIRGGVSFLVY